jgi:hypothetical protein
MSGEFEALEEIADLVDYERKPQTVKQLRSMKQNFARSILRNHKPHWRHELHGYRAAQTRQQHRPHD